MDKVYDMPKLESPFVRTTNAAGEYLVTDAIAPGYEWVFNDPSTMAIEKLHGTNVSVVIQDGVITSLWNRTARIPIFNKGKIHITLGVLESFDRGYCELTDGQHFGELIGPKINGNPYKLDKHLWIPFNTYGQEHLQYKSWQAKNEDGTLKYPRTYDGISAWFKELMPLYYWRVNGRDAVNPFVEGVVFTHPDGRMAKLRRDMFDWYNGPRHKEEPEKVGE